MHLQHHSIGTAESTLDHIHVAVQACFAAAGWEHCEGSAIARKSFACLSYFKQAHAYLSSGDGFHRSLLFHYESEGRNVAAPAFALIPMLADATRAGALTEVAIARAEQFIRQSYGTRLAHAPR